jgi:hypothetical protein
MAAPVARLGVMRLGASRLNTYQPWVKVLIDGVDRTASNQVLNTSEAQITVTLAQGQEPSVATFRVKGFAPAMWQQVLIYVGDTDAAHCLFRGQVLAVDAVVDGAPTSVSYDVSCIDRTPLLDRRRVLRQYGTQSATAIVLDIMSRYTTGFTTDHVDVALPDIDEITFKNDHVSDALTRVAERIGAYWWIDAGDDLHFTTSQEETAGTITSGSLEGVRTARDLAKSEDYSQVVTRVWSRGGGATAVEEVSPGSAIIKVEDVSWYAASGGLVESGPQRLTYTGFGQPAAPVAAPSGTPGVVAGNLRGGYVYAVTYAREGGETTPGPESSVITAGATGPSAAGLAMVMGSGGAIPTGTVVRYKVAFVTGSGLGSVGLASGPFTVSGGGNSIGVGGVSGPIPTGPAGTTARYLYRSDNNSPYGLIQVIPDNTTTGAVDGNNVLGQPPIETGTPVTVTSIPTGPAGTTARGLYRRSTTATLSKRVVQLNDNVTTTYVDDVADEHLGDEAPRVNTVPPYLAGIPASGDGAVRYTIKQGDQVNVLEMAEDEDAQLAMAALVGSVDPEDGVIEEFISDGRLSATEALNRAQAVLAERKDGVTTVTFATRDQTCTPGRLVSVETDYPAVSGSYRIQRVTVTEIGIDGGAATSRVFPLRAVEASSRRYSFEDLLRRIRGNQ